MVLHTITRNEEAVFFSPQFIYLHDYKIQWKMLISFSLSLWCRNDTVHKKVIYENQTTFY